MSSRRRLQAVQLILLGCGIGLVQVLFYVASYHLRGEPQPWGQMAWNWLRYGLGAFALPWLVFSGLAEPFERGQAARQLRRHALRALLTVAAVYSTYYVLRQLGTALGGEVYAARRVFTALLCGQLVADFFFYLGLASAASARASTRLLYQREAEAARLESALSRAELNLLRAQLNPHFLFNALHTVSALIVRDPEGARRMLARIGDFLRRSLAVSGRHEVPLATELELLECYLEIQTARLRERLRVRIEIEPEAYSALVPNLLLQPLVENAIQHGIGPRMTGGTVWVRAGRSGDLLLLEVGDDGVGMRSLGTPRPRPVRPAVRAGASGYGLANTRERLRRLHGDLELAPGENGGLRARIRLPWRTAPEPSARRAQELAGESRLVLGRAVFRT